jgi:hypothetical protein
VQLIQNQLRALREIDNCRLFNQLRLSATICGESVAVGRFRTVVVAAWRRGRRLQRTGAASTVAGTAAVERRSASAKPIRKDGTIRRMSWKMIRVVCGP